jgi:hypothetical protein
MAPMDEYPIEATDDRGLSRRRVLRGATGGVVLADSGLLLPYWLEDEAEAREGAYGGKLGGRHGPNRRGRDKHKRRDRGDKKANGGRDGAPPKGNGPFRATALTVINRRSQALDCTFFFRIKTGLDDYDLPTANGQRSLAPQESFRYDPDRYRVGVLVKQVFGTDDIYADVRNVSVWFPRGGVTKGSQLDPPNGKFGSAFIDEQMFVQTEAHDKSGITLWRKVDSENRIEWELFID